MGLELTDEEAQQVLDAESGGRTFDPWLGANSPSQPSPYSAALTRVAFEGAAAKAKIDFEAIDTAHALDELEAWIAKSPGTRACWTIDRMGGKWRVGLQQDAERFSASQDAELRGAIRNALMIAKFAGCL